MTAASGEAIANMTDEAISARTIRVQSAGDEAPMNLNLFEHALWWRKVSDPTPNGSVTVTLSTGKTVLVDSKLLGFLRLLSEELAKDVAPRR